MKTRLLIIIGVVATGIIITFDDYNAYGLWESQTPEELFQQSETIFVGTIQSVNVLTFDKSNEYYVEENGVSKIVVENYTQTLDEYTVSIEEFLKNPQESNTITMLEATVGGVPGRSVSIGGFELGDRVLFYVPKIDGTNQYSPESFKIPKHCDAKSVLEQPRIPGANDFRMMQDGITIQDNFTANKKIQFVFEKDMRTLYGARFNVDVAISKILGKNDYQNVLKESIRVESKPCEWVTTAQWNFIPTAGKYSMWMSYGEDDDGTSGRSTYRGGFSVVEESWPQIKIMDGIPFFVSREYKITHNPDDIISFHGVKFTPPAFSDPPAPGGGAFTEITFQDGTKETLSQVGLLKNPILLTTHVYPQAGMKENQYDTFSMLVSADLTKISPLQQFKSGIPTNEIRCQEGLVFAQKGSNGNPICITPETKAELIKRNWIEQSLPPCTSDRTACFNRDVNLCDPKGWECGDIEGIFED